MNRWAKIVVSLSAVATAGWLAAAGLGFRVADTESLARHTLWSFAVLLALVLFHTWVATFAAVSASRLRRNSLEPGGAAELSRIARRALAAGATTLLAVTSQFVVSNLLYPARLSPRWHAISGVASAVVVVVGLVVEARALSAHGKLAARLAARATEPA